MSPNFAVPSAHMEAGSHSRVIIHIDMDCFYAQVEERRDPALAGRPLGVKQKNIVVTCNYEARAAGVKKCMMVEDAMRICPGMTLVIGEDLAPYRHASAQVTSLLQQFSPLVERLGLDENFIDVTQLVNKRIDQHKLCHSTSSEASNAMDSDDTAEPNVYNDDYGSCCCGCRARLIEGSRIAKEVREQIRSELQLTCCAGVAHNKLLAKLVGSTHKPNQQTVVFPGAAVRALLGSLPNVRSLPGVGSRTADILNELGIKSIPELQAHPLPALKGALGCDAALRLKNNSLGVDDSEVKPSGKPLSIGIEDGFRRVSMQSEVREKLSTLLTRLLKLVEEDGRAPTTIKVTVRKLDRTKGTTHRESRQSNVSSLQQDRLMNTVMMLFNRIVDINQPFHLTLLGLAFTKFRARGVGRGSVASFLVRDRDLSVQTLTSLEGEGSGICTPRLPPPLTPNESGSESEPELEPSPKKNRGDSWRGRDLMSPSKLRVSEMCLASRSPRSSIDESILKELPPDIRMEILETYGSDTSESTDCSMDCVSDSDRSPRIRSSPVQILDARPLPKFVEKMVDKPSERPADRNKAPEKTAQPSSTSGGVACGTTEQCSPNAPLPRELPSDVDPAVFQQLPENVQADLLRSWRLEKWHPSKPKQNSILQYMVANSE
ncbi:DNA polymerase iota isoform X2 [Thrips palmi]|uniref:DNA polymerase iota isoform X2 n=1 Tax=Thrips palmi TaxID=161013 RepID=A0A6P8XY35_THRPL|nr:DNA polymerase iota isoform X2 [Thrips palmi]